MKSFYRSALAVLFAAAFLTACGDDVTGPGATVEGSYTLHTFNGQTLPALFDTWHVEGDTYIYRITAGSIDLANGAGTISGSGSYYRNGELVDSDTWTATGSYTVSGQSITLTFNFDGDTETVRGTLSGNTLTIEVGEVGDPEFVYVYHRD